MKRLFTRLRCRLFGHSCSPTGRHAILLTEWRCRDCDGLFVSHVDHGRALMPADAESDQIFRDVERWERDRGVKP